MTPQISTEYQRKGLDVVFLDNEHLHVELLAGKGGDITQIRDKRTDTNVLFEAPHEWRPPTRTYGAPDGTFAFMDHYPGGWQDVLPAAGGPSKGEGAPLALHGESTLLPWTIAETSETDASASVRLSTRLTRYPLWLEREVVLDADSSTLRVRSMALNEGETPVDYSWLQHIAFGSPLVSGDSVLDVPCRTARVDPDQTNESAVLPPGERFDWPICETSSGSVDLRRFPPREGSRRQRVHDLVALCELESGRYTLSNPTHDLGVTVRFPRSVYEYLWYWRPLGGFNAAPFFGRAYGVGLEPATSIPNAGLEAARENGTANQLASETSLSVTLSIETHSVENVDSQQ